MAYFQNFPSTLYKFGDENSRTRFQDLSAYAQVVDDVKDVASAYSKYTILEGERPDQLSFKLYGSTDYYWTFYMMNDNIREQGWPLSNTDIVAFAQSELTLTTLTTRTVLTDKFKIGQTVEGQESGATGTIDHRHLDLGQLLLSGVSGTFTAGENINSTTDEGIEVIVLESSASEYNSVHHYEDGDGEWTDIDPTVGPGASLSAVTHLDRYIRLNNALKEIKVLKRDALLQVVRAYNEAIAS